MIPLRYPRSHVSVFKGARIHKHGRRHKRLGGEPMRHAATTKQQRRAWTSHEQSDQLLQGHSQVPYRHHTGMYVEWPVKVRESSQHWEAVEVVLRHVSFENATAEKDNLCFFDSSACIRVRRIVWTRTAWVLVGRRALTYVNAGKASTASDTIRQTSMDSLWKVRTELLYCTERRNS